MSWTQVLNDVTSRISAASQSLQALDPYHRTYPSASASLNDPACSPIYPDSQPSSMSVRVQLDQQNAPFYTNLDFVSGRVLLSLATDTTISAINVKLEGESRTRLSGPKYLNDPRNRQKIELEVHKLLYKVTTVFPTANITQDAANAQFTLPAGQYTYPFSIKIPFNNDCTNNNNLFQDMRIGPLLSSDPTNVRHVKQTLPPTLGGFPGEADIKYFVKATVIRPKFYHENIRSIVDIKFQPIEPPRPESRNEETYARRQHQFQAIIPVIPPKGSLSSLFRKSSTSQVEGPPPSIKVDARLPNPAILSCHQPIPLRVLVDKTNDSPASIYLSLLQVELIGSTYVRAHDLNRTETGSWVLMSQANMNLPLDIPTDSSGRSFEIPSRFWSDIPLPNTVAPSFKTCNLSRTYELEVRVGISHGIAANDIRPELIILPLRIPVQVYSGVSPSAKLLHRISTHQPSSSTLTPPRPTNTQHQPSPITPTADTYPPQSGSYMAPPLDDPNDLPPSYEDALAEDIAPVDGPRREYNTSGAPNSTRQNTNPDSKYGSGLNRHGSERLFSQNAPSPPTSVSPTNTQTTGPTAEQISSTMASLSISDSPIQQRPPPLPVRKATVESTKSQKEKA